MQLYIIQDVVDGTTPIVAEPKSKKPSKRRVILRFDMR